MVCGSVSSSRSQHQLLQCHCNSGSVMNRGLDSWGNKQDDDPVDDVRERQPLVDVGE